MWAARLFPALVQESKTENDDDQAQRQNPLAIAHEEGIEHVPKAGDKKGLRRSGNPWPRAVRGSGGGSRPNHHPGESQGARKAQGADRGECRFHDNLRQWQILATASSKETVSGSPAALDAIHFSSNFARPQT